MLNINQSLVRKLYKPENLEKMDRADCQSPRARIDNSRMTSIRESIEEIQPLVQLGNFKLKSSSGARDSSGSSDSPESNGNTTSVTCFSGLGGKLFQCFGRREDIEEDGSDDKEHPKLTGSV